MDTVYCFTYSFWSTVSEEWEEVTYYTMTPDNNQFMTETLIRDENQQLEDISLEVEEQTLDWFDSCGYSRDMLL